MASYILRPTGVDDFDDTGTTYGDIWDDNSDSTYAPVGNSSPSPDSRGYLPTYTGGVISTMSVHFRASATGDAHQPLMVELDRNNGSSRLIFFHGGSSLGRSANPVFWDAPVDWDIPNDDTIRDYSVAIDDAMLTTSGWDTIDELREDLAGPDCVLYFWADGYYDLGDPAPTGEIRIYEAWLEIGAADLAAPITGQAMAGRTRFI